MATINGTSSDNFLSGTTGSDIINGLGGNDFILADDGDDDITGGAGYDIINGGAGGDIYRYYMASQYDIITDTSGNDTLSLEDINFHNDDFGFQKNGDDLILHTLSGAAIITNHFDVLQNNSIETVLFEDVGGYRPSFLIETGAGADFVTSLTGGTYLGDSGVVSNMIFGGLGDDTIIFDPAGSGAAGNILGGAGNDILHGGASNTGDLLFGNTGNDTIFGYGGGDQIWGGSGDDVLYSIDNESFTTVTATTQLFGGAGNDYLFGSAGSEHMVGGEGDDVMYGFGGDDRYYVGLPGTGYLAADSSSSVFGNDRIYDDGGNNDTIYIHDSINAFAYSDVVFSRNGDHLILTVAGFGEMIFDNHFEASGQYKIEFLHSDSTGLITVDSLNVGFAASNSDDEIFTSAAGSVINAMDGNDTVFGKDGIDSINGGEGDDIILAGGGDDVVQGGEGDDEIFAESGNDQLSGDAGDDKLWGSEGNNTLTGGDDDDYIHGWGGQDVIYGDSGNDELHGDDDNDEIQGGSDQDRIYGGNGDDTIYGDNDINLNLGDDDIIFGGDGMDFVNGGGGDDQIYGDTETWNDPAGDDDMLYGNAGNDGIFGGGGDDQLFGESGNDDLRGNIGNDTLRGGDGSDLLQGGDGNDVLYGYGELTGTDTHLDRIYGDAGDDIIYGGSGGDIIFGGTGSDTFVVETTSTSTVPIAKVNDFEDGIDKIDLSNVISFDPLTDSIGDFVNIAQGFNTTIQVDASGNGGAGGWTNALRLRGNTTLSTDAQDLLDDGTFIV